MTGNSISTGNIDDILRSAVDNTARQLCAEAFTLGFEMARHKEPFTSPFNDDSLSYVWEEGYKDFVYREGMSSAHANLTIVNCPYDEYLLCSIWCEGMTAAEESRRKSNRKKRERRRVAWHEVGF